MTNCSLMILRSLPKILKNKKPFNKLFESSTEILESDSVLKKCTMIIMKREIEKQRKGYNCSFRKMSEHLKRKKTINTWE